MKKVNRLYDSTTVQNTIGKEDHMLGLLMKFLPPQAKAAIELAQRLTASLDTPEEREAAIKYCSEILADGKITMVEWSKLGKVLQVYGKK
tara:strand:- start:137 stop:406 length:270 start_codon:yes stop_codon:yes gene_type:complete